MDYVYCIKRGKMKRLLDGMDADKSHPVHIADYCFKPYYGFDPQDEAYNRKMLARKTNSSVRSWRRNGETPEQRLFVTGDYEDGNTVYRCLKTDPVFYDETELGGRWMPVVGMLIETSHGFVIHFNEEEQAA